MLTNIQNETDTIFHYTNTQTAIEHILFEKRLRLSPYKYSYDPWEYQKRYFCAYGRTDEKHITTKLDELNDLANKIITTNIKIVCFCSHNNDVSASSALGHGYAKSRMWAQYGEKNSGIALGFSQNILEKELQKTFGMNEIYFKNVDYTNENSDYMSSAFQSKKIANERNLVKLAEKHVWKYKDQFFFSKCDDYINENEYRIIILDSKNEYVYLPIEQSLKCIILGEKFHDSYLPLISKYSDEIGIPCFRAKWQPYQFLLSEIPKNIR